ncbi:MAG: helicase, partial [Desulfobacterales bacterium]
MVDLSRDYIRDHLADSAVIFKRGVNLYEHGSFMLKQADVETGRLTYEMDGNYGDYTISLHLAEDKLETACDCPYPGSGCKHTVAALLDAHDVVRRWRQESGGSAETVEEPYLTAEEIRRQAIDDRKRRARTEAFTVTEGDML